MATTNKVKDRIAAIEDVADALFDEWNDELALYKSATLKREIQKAIRDMNSAIAESNRFIGQLKK